MLRGQLPNTRFFPDPFFGRGGGWIVATRVLMLLLLPPKIKQTGFKNFGRKKIIFLRQRFFKTGKLVSFYTDGFFCRKKKLCFEVECWRSNENIFVITEQFFSDDTEQTRDFFAFLIFPQIWRTKKNLGLGLFPQHGLSFITLVGLASPRKKSSWWISDSGPTKRKKRGSSSFLAKQEEREERMFLLICAFH